MIPSDSAPPVVPTPDHPTPTKPLEIWSRSDRSGPFSTKFAGREARRPRIDWRADRGQFAGIEALPFGVLIFVIGTLLVANAWAVVDAKLAVSAAAREGARAYVEAPPDLDVAAAAARHAGLDTIASHGRDPAAARITVDNPAGAYARCVRVTVHAGYRIPAVTLPLIGGYGRGFEVTSYHSELIDPWRDDVPGTGCG